MSFVDLEPRATDALIPAGQALSAPVDLENQRLHRIDMPAAWTAAPITLLVAYQADAVYRPLYTPTAEYVITAADAGRSILIDPGAAFGIRFLIVRSGQDGAPVNQAADRILKLVTEDL